MDGRQGSSLERTQRAGPWGGGVVVFMLPLSCLISILESIFVQVLSAGKNVCGPPTWGRDQAGHGGCSLVASLRERRGWAPRGWERGFNLSGAFCGSHAATPKTASPCPVHTEAPTLPYPPSS